MRNGVRISLSFLVLILPLTLAGCGVFLAPSSISVEDTTLPLALQDAYLDETAIRAACESSLSSAVPAYGTLAMESGLPTALVDLVSSRRIALVGERHYMAEHQKMLVSLMTAVRPKGKRILVQEIDQALSLVVDDYVAGDRESIPHEAMMLDDILVEGLRALNRGLPAAERVHFGYFDVNHTASSFCLAIEENADLRSEPCFAAFIGKRADAAYLRGSAYRAELVWLAAALESGRADYVAKWGEYRHAAVLRATECEISSFDYRAKGLASVREDAIFANVSWLAERWPDGIVVNTGSAHAPKAPLYVVGDNEGNWFGSRLYRAFGGETCAIIAEPVAGSLPSSYTEYWPRAFDCRVECEGADLMRILPDIRPGELVYLPFAATPFVDRKIGIKGFAYVPAEHYDAILVYPEVTTIKMR